MLGSMQIPVVFSSESVCQLCIHMTTESLPNTGCCGWLGAGIPASGEATNEAQSAAGVLSDLLVGAHDARPSTWPRKMRIKMSSRRRISSPSRASTTQRKRPKCLTRRELEWRPRQDSNLRSAAPLRGATLRNARFLEGGCAPLRIRSARSRFARSRRRNLPPSKNWRPRQDSNLRPAD